MLRFNADGRTDMAQKVQVLLVDDLDQGPADETVTFALDGTSYEIDLSAKNAAKLRDALSLYVGSARRVGARASGAGRGPGRSRPASRRSGNRSAQIRAWARENNIEVSERGRVPASVVAQYEQAHG